MKITTLYALGQMAFHVIIVSLAVISLFHISVAQEYPEIVTQILYRVGFMIPLFVLLMEVLFVGGGRYPKTVRGIILELLPLLALIMSAVIFSRTGGSDLVIMLATPMILSFGIVWLCFGIIGPIMAFADEPIWKRIPKSTLGMALFGLFSAPAIALAYVAFRWNVDIIRSTANIWAIAPLIGSMIWVMVMDGKAYVEAMNKYGR